MSANVDDREKFSSSLFGSLLPLCRWVLTHWLELFATEARPLPGNAVDPFEYLSEVSEQLEDADDETIERVRLWWVSHNLRGGRDGAAIPDVFLWRQGGSIIVSWRPDREPFASSNVRFVPSQGRIELEVGEVAQAFRELCEVVQERLNARGISVGEDEWTEEFAMLFREVRSERFRLVHALESSGLDAALFARIADVPTDVLIDATRGGEAFPEVWQRVRTALDLPADGPLEITVVGSAPLALFRSAAPTLDRTDVDTLWRLVGVARERNGDDPALKSVRAELAEQTAGRPEHDSPLYRVGQRRARMTRSALGLSLDAPIDIEALLHQLLGYPVESCWLSDSSIDAVSIWSDMLGPVVAVNDGSRMATTKWGRRMALAHELAHLLFDSAHGRPLGIASGRWAPITLEKIANAYAAELLLPHAGLIHQSRVDEAVFKEIMAKYGVGATVAAHQLRNKGIIDESEADFFMQEFSNYRAEA